MELVNDFEEFLKEIRPTDNQKQDMKNGHTTLRERLRGDKDLSDIYISDFLQGSYRRHTTVRPKGEKKSDVDIIVVTSMSEHEYTPNQALDRFEPFLKKYYEGKYERQGRSFGIKLSYVEMDLVITSAPSETYKNLYKSEAVTTLYNIDEAQDWRLNNSWIDIPSRYAAAARLRLEESKKEEEWKTEPLRIPDRETSRWDDTHPFEQIKVTRDKNSSCNRHFVNVVKALKWWRLEKNGDGLKHPKGFPLERLIGECCLDGITSIARGVTNTLEMIVNKYGAYVELGIKPELPDYGVPTHDVFKRVTPEDFKEFYGQAKEAAKVARQALDSSDQTESANLWRELFGSKFPKSPDKGGESKGGFEKPTQVATPPPTRFA